MQLKNLFDGNFTPQELALIEKARIAVSKLNHSFETKSGGITWKLHTAAFIHPRSGTQPLRLDFQAGDDQNVGHAFLGPDLPLTNELFNGDSLKPEIIEQFTQTCRDFERHLEETIS